jgi:CRP/FNR family cyclic AMP-dependent transcriptional regulator
MNAADLAASVKAEEVTALLPFLLLAIAMFMPRLNRLRGFAALAALAGIGHSLFVAKMPTAAAGWALLLAAACLLLVHRLHKNKRVRFTFEEEALVAGLLSELSPTRARHLLDQGFWLSGKAGDVLTREEEPVSHLFYLAAGEARVMSHGRLVGTCHAGDLIGEVTVLSGEQASATVTLNGPARFWCAPASALRPYLHAHEDVRRALEHGFAESLRGKLRATNRTIVENADIAEKGGIAA